MRSIIKILTSLQDNRWSIPILRESIEMNLIFCITFQASYQIGEGELIQIYQHHLLLPSNISTSLSCFEVKESVTN